MHIGFIVDSGNLEGHVCFPNKWKTGSCGKDGSFDRRRGVKHCDELRGDLLVYIDEEPSGSPT